MKPDGVSPSSHVTAPRGDVQVLFVTWDGPRSTYLQGLFLPIFTALRAQGYAFHVLQFTWSAQEERDALAEACRAVGVSYRSARIWRRPIALGSLASAFAGRMAVRRAVRELGIQLLMPRSTLPAIATSAGAGKGMARLPVLLDADGLPHDERVEFGGASATGLSYRLLRDLEAWSIRGADAVTVRTRSAAEILKHRAGTGIDDALFHVVANARDPRLFQPFTAEIRARRRAELGIGGDQPVLVYVGSSLTGKYRGDAVFRFFRQVRLRRPDARLLILMPSHDDANALLERYPDLASACIMRSAIPSEVAGWLGIGDLGLVLIHATFSMQAVAAVKLAEYLLCGLPVLASSRVGDTDMVLDDMTGHRISEHDDAVLGQAAEWFLDRVIPDRDGFRVRCRAVGVAHFAMDDAIGNYDRALRAALASAAVR